MKPASFDSSAFDSTGFDPAGADPPLLVVVGAGGVGKTTLAASLGLLSARAGHDTLVMTFDPSLRLKDALGVGEDAARDGFVEVDAGTSGVLHASLLDARLTFDRLVERHSADEAARRRILENRYYDHLAGHLGGILEYMAVERLYEVAQSGRYQRVILDTPPTNQAIDFLKDLHKIEIQVDNVFAHPVCIGEARIFVLGGVLRKRAGFVDSFPN